MTFACCLSDVVFFFGLFFIFSFHNHQKSLKSSSGTIMFGINVCPTGVGVKEEKDAVPGKESRRSEKEARVLARFNCSCSCSLRYSASRASIQQNKSMKSSRLLL